jgi:predicted phage terminase large subunit-like protein
MSEGFILDCASWAEIVGALIVSVDSPHGQVESFIDPEGILGFRLRFATGHQIVALSSKPTNLRGKQGRFVIDEAAFHPDVPAILKAANAALIWGGSVAIISTHDGEDNEFNQVVKASRSGELPYSLHTITFKDAIAQGLYKRICETSNKPWSLESELDWEEEIRKLYGVACSEELDVIPAKIGKGLVFSPQWFKVVESVDHSMTPRFKEIRFWDLAATEKDVMNKRPCYTAGVKMRKVLDLYYVVDVIKVQLNPADIDEVMAAAAELDGQACSIRWEQEGGSAGKRDAAHIAKLLNKYDAQGVLPRGDKVTRARPWASQLKAGNARLLEGDWNKEYIDDHVKFPEGDKDSIDASSGAYDFLASSNMSASDFYAPGAAERALTPQSRLAILKRRGRGGAGGSAGLGGHVKRY